ncbi:hypothetical protein TcasGA2_TC015444 [Tribolium castaneum]|uniref:Chaoptin-like Protein n=1 Tax=Tribolium castaneum TaxID=7070 RepID=D2A4Z7_TRICA|nr:hypothetical protein TcasGA2_TC015444 [Tribolium castaneum]
MSYKTIFLLLLVTNNSSVNTNENFENLTTQNSVQVLIVNKKIPFLCNSLFNFSGQTEHISIIKSNVQKIEKNIFRAHNVTNSVRITFNNISTIRSETFTNLVITLLELYENQIEVIENGAFSDLPNLQTIHLNNNKITRLNPLAFRNLPNLLTLNLSLNRIEKLQNGSLSFAQNQHFSVYLSNNKIACLELNFLERSAKDLNLFLTGNLLQSLPEGIFNNHVLDNVFLESNPLKNITSKICDKNCSIRCFRIDKELMSVFQNFDSIEIFQQKIHVLCNNLFEISGVVQTLSFLNCGIREIESDCFRNFFCEWNFNISIKINYWTSQFILLQLSEMSHQWLTLLLFIGKQFNLIQTCEDLTPIYYFADIKTEYQVDFGSFINNVIATPPNTFHIIIMDQNIPFLRNCLFRTFGEIEAISVIRSNVQEIENKIFVTKNVTTSIIIRSNKITVIKVETFVNLKIKSLDLFDNEIEVVEVGAFCDLPNLKFLYLDKNKITRLNPLSFKNVPKLQVLNLTLNEIEKLDFGSLSFVQMNNFTLDVQANKISSLDVDFLHGFEKNSLSLVLSGNYLKTLPDGIFNGHTFNYLVLDENPWTSLSKAMCGNTCTVRYFSVDDILVNSFDGDVFKWALKEKNMTIRLPKPMNLGLTSILTLFLCVFKPTFNCENSQPVQYAATVRQLEMDAFFVDYVIRTRRNGRTIYIENQNIPVLCQEIFKITHAIKSIYLSNNNIQRLEMDVFLNQNITEFITITLNNINTIQRGTFRQLKITALNLRRNNIEVIEGGAFLDLPNLSDLDLKHNKIKLFDSIVYKGFPKLMTLDLGDNQIGQELENQSLDFIETNRFRLNLSGNKITKIGRNFFKKLGQNYIDLSLSGNFLQTLPDGIFNNCTFSSLYLGKNPLRNVSERICGETCFVNYLILDEGSLENVEKFREWASNRSITLEMLETRQNHCNTKFGINDLLLIFFLIVIK